MAPLAILAFALLAGSVQATFLVGERIATTIDQYPSIVQVDFSSVGSGIWGQSCAGSILTSRYILSAANCFQGRNYNPKNRRVRAGATYRNTGGILSYVDTEFNHPTFGLNGNDGDISVVKLLDQLVYSPQVAQGVYIAQGAGLPDNLPIVHAAWGATIQGGSASNELLENTIFTFNRELCRERYGSLSIPEPVTNNMICAGYHEMEGGNACHGDFGGPVFYKDSVLGNIAVGVVSWGFGCSDNTFPVVSTAVSSYTTWIQETAV